MRRYLLPLASLPCLLAAACGSGEDVEAKLAARRAALGLPAAPVAFAEAMRRMQEGGYEGLLARVGSKRLARDDVVDAALTIEGLLAHADPATAEARPPDPLRFDALLAGARRSATALARAVLSGGDGIEEAGEVIASCTACHLTFRKPR
jgi:hypothetical protein